VVAAGDNQSRKNVDKGVEKPFMGHFLYNNDSALLISI
jgi:hypothetical protein